MATLNEIAYSLADTMGQPLNHMLIERLKFTIKYYRAEFIRQDITKNGNSTEYLQTVRIDLILVDELDDCMVSTGCKVLRSKDKVPKPVRKNYIVPFKYVGFMGFKGAFTHRQGQAEQFAKFNKFTSCTVGYDYKNGYIYVTNTTKLKHALIQDAFVDPEDVNSFCSSEDGSNCYNDDMAFPIPEDMLRTITDSIRRGELRVVGRDDKEIEIKEDKP